MITGHVVAGWSTRLCVAQLCRSCGFATGIQTTAAGCKDMGGSEAPLDGILTFHRMRARTPHAMYAAWSC